MSRRLLAAFAVAALLLAACASDDGAGTQTEASTAVEPGGGDAASPDPAVVDPSDGVPTSIGDAGSVPGSVPPGSGPQAGAGDPAPTPGGAPSTSAPPTTTTSAPVPAPGGVGGYATLYLRPAESASVLLDVHVQDGAAPATATLDHARSVLGQVSGKTIQQSIAALPGGAKDWSSADLRALADQVSPRSTREVSVLTLLYLRGGFAGDDSVVGVAVRSDVTAVFADRVQEAAGFLSNPGAVEDAVTLHEIGHVLGLVDLVLDTGRADPEHPGHSGNTGSVMYFAVESTLLGSVLAGGPPRDFDADDLADLARIRNG